MTLHGNSPVKESNQWPIVGSIALFFLAIGIVNWMHQSIMGPIFFFVGSVIFIYMLFGWFGAVIRESRAGMYDNDQILKAFRWGMFWFIFTEVMFFGSFFGALFYARLVTVPELGGATDRVMTHYLLWPGFKPSWPVYQTPDPSQFTGPKEAMNAWGIPALNTLILMASDIVITWGFWQLLRKNRGLLVIAQVITILLSIAFLCLQVKEYGNAFTELGLTMSSGIYGSTFYMLTGVHATHVIVGIIMVVVLMIRTIRGDFDEKHNFGIAALTWYWHFIDLLWFLLFIFVYWW